jgi:hypothetical protein
VKGSEWTQLDGVIVIVTSHPDHHHTVTPPPCLTSNLTLSRRIPPHLGPLPHPCYRHPLSPHLLLLQRVGVGGCSTYNAASISRGSGGCGVGSVALGLLVERRQEMTRWTLWYFIGSAPLGVRVTG